MAALGLAASSDAHTCDISISRRRMVIIIIAHVNNQFDRLTTTSTNINTHHPITSRTPAMSRSIARIAVVAIASAIGGLLLLNLCSGEAVDSSLAGHGPCFESGLPEYAILKFRSVNKIAPPQFVLFKSSNQRSCSLLYRVRKRAFDNLTSSSVAIKRSLRFRYQRSIRFNRYVLAVSSFLSTEPCLSAYPCFHFFSRLIILALVKI